MKKYLSLILVVVTIISSYFPVQAEERLTFPALGCESAILMDAATGNILYEKNADKKEYPASTTKIMTAYLALELGLKDYQAVVSHKAAENIGINGANAGLKPGEVVRVDDLVHMALVLSANDAANAIAETVSGSIPAFVSLMNRKARELGLCDTTFQNPVGLDVEDGYKEHRTTARDLAMLIRCATSLDAFREVIGKASYRLPRSNIHTGTRPVFQNTNRLLVDSNYRFDDYTIVGGKTGYTKAARHVFAGVAKNDKGIELIVVLMKNPDRDRMFDDAKKLLDYGFSLVRAYPEAASAGFYDLRGHPLEKEINSFLDRGMLSGNAKGAFDSTAPASKEMFIKVLMEIHGLRADQRTSYWSRPYLEFALKQKLIDRTWLEKRSEPVTRGEVIRVLGRLLNLKYTNADTFVLAVYLRDYKSMDPELKGATLEVCVFGLVPYLNEGMLNADRPVSRGELMMILSRYEDVISEYR